MDSGSETRRSSPNLPPSPPHEGEGGELTMARNGQTPNHYRKSLPPAFSDTCTSEILRYYLITFVYFILQVIKQLALDIHESAVVGQVTIGQRETFL